MRLLLVEDDKVLSAEVAADLQRHGFAVDCVFDGLEAAYMGESEPYDVIVLDLGLPEIAGLDVLKQWRKKQLTTPVLVLTARGAWHEKVDGFKAGADDYLAKPFHIEELLVRLEALIRRSKGAVSTHLECAGLKLDGDAQNVIQKVAGEDVVIPLTGVEFRMLRYMMMQPGHIFNGSHLLEHIYDYDSEKESNVIEVYISKLRKKIGKERILTKRGQGYMFNPNS